MSIPCLARTVRLAASKRDWMTGKKAPNRNDSRQLSCNCTMMQVFFPSACIYHTIASAFEFHDYLATYIRLTIACDEVDETHLGGGHQVGNGTICNTLHIRNGAFAARHVARLPHSILDTLQCIARPALGALQPALMASACGTKIFCVDLYLESNLSTYIYPHKITLQMQRVSILPPI